MIDDRTRHGDPLLLPSRQLRRAVVQPITEGEAAKELARLSHRLAAALTTDHRRDGDILLGGKLGHQLVRLEDEADVTIAEGGTPVPREVGQPLASDDHFPSIRGIECAYHLQECRLARPAGADDGEDLSPMEFEADPPQDLQPTEALVNVPHLHQRRIGGYTHDLGCNR